jgi:hypothetical protein
MSDPVAGSGSKHCARLGNARGGEAALAGGDPGQRGLVPPAEGRAGANSSVTVR